MGKALLLTGRPGIGKTTAIQRLLELLPCRAGGFFTQEIREAGVRKGFKIVLLDRTEAVLSHVDIKSRFKVGKYGVDVGALDRVGVAAVRRAINEADCIVIDEIGSMELLSEAFRQAVLEAIDSGKLVIGTITERHHPWVEKLKKRPEVEVVRLTASNRDVLPESLARQLSQRGLPPRGE